MIPLYEHQKQALEKMHNGCILVGDVGSGKSRTALAYFYSVECGGRLATKKGYLDSPMRRPKDLYIITTAKKRDMLDWEKEALYFGINKDPSLSSIKFVVDSWNNIGKYLYVRNAFFIFDEQRVVGSGAWVRDFIRIVRNGNRWILLSATPGDNWSDYIPVFIANGFYRNRTEFLKKHAVFSRFSKYPKIERYIGCDELAKNKERVLVLMPFVRNTRTNVKPILCSYDKHTFMRVYRGRWDPFKNKPISQAGEWVYLLRKVVNEDRSRLEAVLDIFEEKKRVIIFYNFDYELEILRDFLNDYAFGKGIEIAEYNGHVHNPLPTSKSWVYLIQYTAGAEGWNCITTDTIIFFSLNYSYKTMKQSSGRINRLDTPYYDLYYYILYSESTIDRSILTSLKNKRSFNENGFYNKKFGKGKDVANNEKE